MSRRAIVSMSEKAVWNAIVTGKPMRFVSNVPKTARLCGSYYKCETATFSLVFEDDSIPPACEGDYYPTMALDVEEVEEPQELHQPDE